MYTATREFLSFFKALCSAAFCLCIPKVPKQLWQTSTRQQQPSQLASADLSAILMSLFRRLMALEATLTSLRITAVRLLGYPSPQDQREVFRDLRRLQQDSEKRIRASGIELKLFLVVTKLES